MKNEEIKNIIKELMEKYEEKRILWRIKNGSYEGFDEWFTKQIELKV